MVYDASRFKSTVEADFARRRNISESRGQFSHGAAPMEVRASLGHPLFEPLKVGEKRSADVAAVFLDLTNFTGRSFWDDADEVADLSHAILTGFIQVVAEFGGFPLGLRGDGLFAAFGPGAEAVDVSLALAACAFALNAVQTEVNPWLKSRGIEPVQARAGVDFGRITFVRSGSVTSSEVNPVGFAANFAAKCEKTAKSWEVVAGERAARALGQGAIFVHHADSPKKYTRDYQSEYYRFFDYGWRQVLPTLPSVLRELAGRPTTSIGVR